MQKSSTPTTDSPGELRPQLIQVPPVLTLLVSCCVLLLVLIIGLPKIYHLGHLMVASDVQFGLFNFTLPLLLFFNLTALIHETGHAFFGLIFKIGVAEFCIGKPKLIGFKVGKTTYSLGLPIGGGFVTYTERWYKLSSIQKIILTSAGWLFESLFYLAMVNWAAVIFPSTLPEFTVTLIFTFQYFVILTGLTTFTGDGRKILAIIYTQADPFFNQILARVNREEKP